MYAISKKFLNSFYNLFQNFIVSLKYYIKLVVLNFITIFDFSKIDNNLVLAMLSIFILLFFVYITVFFFKKIPLSIFFYFLAWINAQYIYIYYIVNPQKQLFFFINSNTMPSQNLLFDINWGFTLDFISASMLIVVLTIAFLVYCYSIEYMKNDINKYHFFSYLLLFTSAMLLLIISPNFIQLYVGWEGVGICSFLLINFWSSRIQANKAAIKALIYNKIGDSGLLLAIALIANIFYTFDFETIFFLAPYFISTKLIIFNTYAVSLLNLITICLLIACVGKSAQIGLHSWLPDAMEGPTPVSALLHAATMVTAGVFLVIRCSALFNLAPTILLIMGLIGALTAFMAATIGLFQNDIKKIIAYSTCSQLGFMVYGCSQMNYLGSLFHLFNHAFFKALLFLVAGVILHALYENQNIYRMGSLIFLFPFTHIAFFVGSLSISGFPFFSGYYSKDFILEWALVVIGYSNSPYAFLSFFLILLATLGTVLYSTKLLYLVFYGQSRIAKGVFKKGLAELTLLEYPYTVFVILILSIFSIISGYFFKRFYIGDFSNFILPFFYKNSDYMYHFIVKITSTYFLHLFLLILIIIFPILFIFLFSNNILLFFKNKHYRLLSYFFMLKWYIDLLNNRIAHYFLKFIYFFNIFDSKVIEKFNGQCFYKILFFFSSFFQTVIGNKFNRNFLLFLVIVFYSMLLSLFFFFC